MKYMSERATAATAARSTSAMVPPRAAERAACNVQKPNPIAVERESTTRIRAGSTCSAANTADSQEPDSSLDNCNETTASAPASSSARNVSANSPGVGRDVVTTL